MLKKRKERNVPKRGVSPITMCQIAFKEGMVFNNTNILGLTRRNVEVGIRSEFKEISDGSVKITFLSKQTRDTESWTIYKDGEYAQIVGDNKI